MTAPTENTLHNRVALPMLVIMGAVYWFAAALVVRWTAPDWVGSTAATLVVLGLILGITPAALWLGMRVSDTGRAQAGYVTTVMTTTALLLDGIALTWLPSLYGTNPAIVLGGAAAIMFGAGAALVIGMMIERS